PRRRGSADPTAAAPSSLNNVRRSIAPPTPGHPRRTWRWRRRRAQRRQPSAEPRSSKESGGGGDKDLPELGQQFREDRSPGALSVPDRAGYPPAATVEEELEEVHAPGDLRLVRPVTRLVARLDVGDVSVAVDAALELPLLEAGFEQRLGGGDELRMRP